MKALKDILDKAGVKQDLKLRLFTKQEGGSPQTTGPHKVKLINSKIIKGTKFLTGEEIAVVRLSLEENGEEKIYDFPVKDTKGDVHYLVQRLAEFPEGSEIILEGKSQGGRSFTDVQPVNASATKVNTTTDDIPVIDETETPPVKPVTEQVKEEETDETNESEDEIDISKLNFK